MFLSKNKEVRHDKMMKNKLMLICTDCQTQNSRFDLQWQDHMFFIKIFDFLVFFN